MYIQETWNAELYDPLMELYKRGKDKASKPDVILRTHWMAMGKELEAFLEAEGLTTLLFAGLNIQQAVWAVSSDCTARETDPERCLRILSGSHRADDVRSSRKGLRYCHTG